MASVQQAKDVNQLSKKEKDAIDEAVKEAENNLKNNAKASQEQLVVVTGVMKNLQEGDLLLAKSHVWKGQFINGPPEKFDETGAFVHEGAVLQGQNPEVVGSKAVVIYQQFITIGVPPLGWLLAWNKPPQNSLGINQVYVEAGDIKRLMNMDLSEIERKLDESRNISRYWDSNTGATAAARIDRNNGDRVALVGAAFGQRDGIPPQ